MENCEVAALHDEVLTHEYIWKLVEECITNCMRGMQKKKKKNGEGWNCMWKFPALWYFVFKWAINTMLLDYNNDNVKIKSVKWRK